MRILCVNRYRLPSADCRNFATANVLQDYEAVVVDPEDLDSLYGEVVSYYGSGALTFEAGIGIAINSKKRMREIEGLLELGGIVVCFMRPLVTSSFALLDEQETWENVTNYDWLKSSLYECIKGLEAGCGEKVDLVNQSHPFTAYLKNKPSWTAFIRHENDYTQWRVLARAYGTHDLALVRRQGRGHIVLLPSGRFNGYEVLLESCIRSLLGEKEPREKPIWVREIILPQQKELQDKIKQTEDEIERLKKERDKLGTSDEQLERWKWLIWENGRDYLEPVVREALELIGCQIETQPVEDSDGKVESEFGTALLEVEGSVAVITRDKLGQLVVNKEKFLKEKGISVKGIFVGNPFRKERLENRPPQDTQKRLFAKELIEDAEGLNITVLLSTDLYTIVCGIINGSIGEDRKKELRQAIFEGKGLVRLEP